MRPGRLPAAAAAALALALLGAPAPGGEDASFMPKGGKTLLLEVLGKRPAPEEVRKITLARHTEAEWRAAMAARAPGLTPRQLDTLAAYLDVHMPLPEGAVKEALARGDLAGALPPDGRELAWIGCQHCHSLFTSHLTQVRDLQGWRNMFLSPFHRELKLSEREREEFARYSALNMPMKIEEVPEDLRF